MTKTVQHIHVTCAIIEQNGCVLAARRSAAMQMPGKWEFPGGKIRVGENPEECLRRELVEELGLFVRIERPLAAVTHRYPDFTITLYPFVCVIEAGTLTLHEHAAALWLPPAELEALDWAEADVPVLAAYLASVRK